MSQVFKNNVRVVLASDITALDTSIVVLNGAQLPALTGDNYFLLTLDNGVIEVVKVTQVVGNTLTVVRGQEGTVAQSYMADTVGEVRVTAGWLNKVENLVDDTTASTATTYSSSKVQELHDAQQQAISTLSGASASFGSVIAQVVPESPSAFADLVWVNSQESSNSNVFELGSSSFTFHKEGNYSFLNSLTFLRSGSGAATTVTFELYNVGTGAVITTFTQPLDIPANTLTSVPMNAVLSVAGSLPVTVKVRMRMGSVAGTLSLVMFNSILAAQSVTTDMLIADGQVSTTKVWSSDKVSMELQAVESAALPVSSYTASDVLTKIKTVDGVGSGLDADTLDGIDSTGFMQTSGNQIVTGTKTFSNSIVGSITGNSATATKLATARTINGVLFDGTANITVNAVDSTARIAVTEKGVANGVATLDSGGKVPSTQLPSYVDDVLEYTNLAGFPATGETGKIYVAKDTNKTYRWSGTVYVYITSGAVDSVAGKTGVVTLTKSDVGLGSVDNTSDSAKVVLSATKLLTPRAINGVNFDGSADITITNDSQINTTNIWSSSKVNGELQAVSAAAVNTAIAIAIALG